MENTQWKQAIISPGASLREAIEAINAGQMQIAMVVDEKGYLAGVVADGDVRRALLKDYTLESPVHEMMQNKPITARVQDTTQQMINKMRQRKVGQLPVVDDNHILHRVESLQELLTAERQNNRVVIMAGGLGTRLGGRTENTPKPLLDIGGKPILETILENLLKHGFHQFTFSTRYLATQIHEYFGDGRNWGANIDYITEEQPLGTAGALSLLKERPDDALVVMNGDVLTKISFRQFLRFHGEHASLATMAVRGFAHQVPYGVVQTNGVEITALEEKPVQSVMVNAGIYALEPKALDVIPKGKAFDMPELFEALIANQQKTAAFPIHEYWIDVGQEDDFTRADAEYQGVFGATN